MSSRQRVGDESLVLLLKHVGYFYVFLLRSERGGCWDALAGKRLGERVQFGVGNHGENRTMRWTEEELYMLSRPGISLLWQWVLAHGCIFVV